MATQLDQEIEQLQHIVEKYLDLHNVKIGCAAPASHRPTEPHEAPIESLAYRVSSLHANND